MTTLPPMPPMPPIDLAAKAAGPQASEAAKPPQADPASAHKFAALMNDPAAATPQAAAHHDLAANAMQSEQDSLRGLDERMRAFTEAAPHMSVAEVTAANIRLTHDLTMATTRLSLVTTVTKKSNDSFNSLLKNQ